MTTFFIKTCLKLIFITFLLAKYRCAVGRGSTSARHHIVNDGCAGIMYGRRLLRKVLIIKEL